MLLDSSFVAIGKVFFLQFLRVFFYFRFPSDSFSASLYGAPWDRETIDLNCMRSPSWSRSTALPYRKGQELMKKSRLVGICGIYWAERTGCGMLETLNPTHQSPRCSQKKFKTANQLRSGNRTHVCKHQFRRVQGVFGSNTADFAEIILGNAFRYESHVFGLPDFRLTSRPAFLIV